MDEATRKSTLQDSPANPTQDQSTKTQKDKGETVQPQVNTYHCICNNLVLATSRTIPTLSRRAGSSQDRAFILPSPRPPRKFTKRMRAFAAQASEDEESESSASESDSDVVADEAGRLASLVDNLVISVSLPRAAGATMVRREDGFEKRWLLRCGRCRLVVGYHLDWVQFQATAAKGAISSSGQDEERNVRRGCRSDVMYILPGALRSTKEMVEAKKIADEDVGFGIAKGVS